MVAALAIWAAAGEPRIARVICDDILTGFLACNLRQFPASARIAVKALLRLRASCEGLDKPPQLGFGSMARAGVATAINQVERACERWSAGRFLGA